MHCWNTYSFCLVGQFIIANRRNWIELKNSTIYDSNDFDTALLSRQAIQQRNNALWISVFNISTVVPLHNQNFPYESDQWIWTRNWVILFQVLMYSLSKIDSWLKMNFEHASTSFISVVPVGKSFIGEKE